MILIENYDSFTYNLVQYLRELGVNPLIIKNDETSLEEIEKMNFSSLIISPGPSNPDNAGISLDIIDKFYKTKKIFGVCLGHQCIAQYFGAKIVKSNNPMHGKVSKVNFLQDEILFNSIPQGFFATRYHSLVVDNDSVSYPIEIIAKTEDDVIMAIKHSFYCVYGVQFHPEAILTQFGKVLLSNFINL